MKRNPIKGSVPGPFFAYDFKAIGDPHATIYRQGDGQPDDFIMQVASVEGGDRLAALLNEAVSLGQRLDLFGSSDPAFCRSKVAYAVAKALGGAIELASFQE